MRALLVIIAVLLAPGSALGKTFICDAKSASTFATGAFKPIANEKHWLNLIRTVTFDEDTGLLRYGSEGHWMEFKMTVLQRGTQSNSTLAVYSQQGAARHVLTTLRIASWERGAPFVWDNQGDFFVGTCTAYGN